MPSDAKLNEAWPELQRSQCAVVVVDVVESTRIMEADEMSAIMRWRRVVDHLRRELLPAHGGRLVKSLGDGLLLRFQHADSASSAAFEMHRECARLEQGVDANMALRLRIAIHQCEVVEDDLDIYGAGVNLAARLATLAGPGDTVVSCELRDGLVDGQGCHVVDLGDCYFKHLDRPVRAFRLLPPSQGPHPLLEPGQARDDRPAVAVFPFESAEVGAPWGLTVADGLILALSGSPGLRVISILSTVACSHGRAPLQAAHKALGAAYVVTGNFEQSGGGSVLMHVKLCATRDGRTVWSQHFPADPHSLLSDADETLKQIAADVGREVLRVEIHRARSLPFANLESYTLYLTGMFMLHRLSRKDFQHAFELLEHLRQRHPRNPAPLALLGKWHLLQAVQGWAADRGEAARLSRAHSQRALDLDPTHALALSMSAIVSAQMDGDLPRALALGRAAVDANPQESHAWLNLGGIHSYLGHGEEAEAMPMQAIALSPMDPARFAFNAFLAEGRLVAGKPAAAAAAAREAIRLNAMHATPHRILTISLMMAGEAEQARRAAADLLRVDPGFRIASYAQRYPGRAQRGFSDRLKALREAGVPA